MKATDPDFKATAEKFGIPEETVRFVWFETFKYIRQKMHEIEFLALTDDELEALKTDFTLPGFGKLRVHASKTKFLTRQTRAVVKKKYEAGRIEEMHFGKMDDETLETILKLAEKDLEEEQTQNNTEYERSKESEGYQADVHEDSDNVQ